MPASIHGRGGYSINPECPMCGGDSAAIMYGLPADMDKLEKELNAGKVTLGGCCVSGDSPEWECNKCGYTWGKLER